MSYEKETLYKRTKEGVNDKLVKHKKKRQRTAMMIGALGGVFVLGNVTVYASSKAYRNWLATQLGVSEQKVVEVDQNVSNKEIAMNILSYYRVDNTVIVSGKLNRTDHQEFSEEVNIEQCAIAQSKTSSGEVLSSYCYLSEDKKTVLFLLTMHVVTDEVTIELKDLNSMVTGNRLYSGDWTVTVDVTEQTDVQKEFRVLENRNVQIWDHAYTIKKMTQVGNSLIFSCDAKTVKQSEEDRFAASLGGKITFEYTNGTKNEDYSLVADKDDNLILSVWDSNHLEHLSKIYIDGKELKVALH